MSRSERTHVAPEWCVPSFLPSRLCAVYRAGGADILQSGWLRCLNHPEQRLLSTRGWGAPESASGRADWALPQPRRSAPLASSPAVLAVPPHWGQGRSLSTCFLWSSLGKTGVLQHFQSGASVPLRAELQGFTLRRPSGGGSKGTKDMGQSGHSPLSPHTVLLSPWRQLS